MEAFKVKVGEKEVELVIRKPNDGDHREAEKIYHRTFKDAIDSGAIIRLKVEKVLRDQGIWNDEIQARVKTLQEELHSIEKKLFVSGGIKLSEGKDLALKMKEKRAELRDILSERTALDSMTAEASADNARFNYLVSRCLVYNDTNKPYFKDYSDYKNNISSDAAIKGASKLASMIYELPDYESTLPENKFLKKWGFIDEKYRLVNKDGKLVDKEGRLINENGRYVDKDGNFVDKDGNPVDEQGDYTGVNVVFYDDDGNIVTPPEPK